MNIFNAEQLSQVKKKKKEFFFLIYRSWPMMDRHLDNHAWLSPSAKTGVKKIN